MKIDIIICLIIIGILYLTGNEQFIILPVICMLSKKSVVDGSVTGGKSDKKTTKKPFTFLLDPEPDYKVYFHIKLRKFLKSLGWKEYKVTDKLPEKLDLVNIKPIRYALLKGTPSKIALYSRKEGNIMFKNNLYKNLQKLKMSHYMPLQYNIDIDDSKSYPDRSLIDGSVWILKPVVGSRGRGIQMVRSHAEFIKLTEAEKTSGNFRNRLLNTDPWVLSKYITKPLLWDGHKFHLRLYYFITNINKKKSGYILKYGKVFVGKNKYDIESSDILTHNIHAYNSDSYNFPEDFDKKFKSGINKSKKIFDQLLPLLTKLFKYSRSECFSDNDHCYNLYGMDVMVMPDFKIKIIEINTHPAASTKDDIATDKLIESINELVIQPIMYDNVTTGSDKYIKL